MEIIYNKNAIIQQVSRNGALSGSNFGAKFGMPPMGTLYAPNLTPSGNIKDWTDGELIRAIREGVHKNGRALLIMPSGNFRNMSDEDVAALGQIGVKVPGM